MNTLQIKLARLEAQLKITKGNRAKAKIVIAILAVESAIEQLKSIAVTATKQEKAVKKEEFCKKPEKSTVKLLQLRFKNAEISIAENKINLNSQGAELSLNCSFSLDVDYYGNNRKTKIRKLKEAQTAKVHATFEFVGTILLAS